MVKEISAEQKATLVQYWIPQRILPAETSNAECEGTFIVPKNVENGKSPLDVAQLIHDALGIKKTVQGVSLGKDVVFKIVLQKEDVRWLNDARTEWEQRERATSGRSV